MQEPYETSHHHLEEPKTWQEQVMNASMTVVGVILALSLVIFVIIR